MIGNYSNYYPNNAYDEQEALDKALAESAKEAEKNKQNTTELSEDEKFALQLQAEENSKGSGEKRKADEISEDEALALRLQAEEDANGTEKEKPAEKKQKTEEKVKFLQPTVGEPWIKHEVSMGDRIAITLAKPAGSLALSRVSNGKEIQKMVDKIEVKSLKTLGDVEKKAIEIINATEPSQSAREEGHNKVKHYLKMWAKDGLTKVIGEATKLGK